MGFKPLARLFWRKNSILGKLSILYPILGIIRGQRQRVSRHTSFGQKYRWLVCKAVTGIGSDNVIGVEVDHGARVDIEDLRKTLQKCLDNKQAVYSVVTIIGFTEEGAVDPLRDVIALRNEFREKGLSFLIHGDAAWGGYFCSMIPQDFEPGKVIKLPSEKGCKAGFVPDSVK